MQRAGTLSLIARKSLKPRDPWLSGDLQLSTITLPEGHSMKRER